MILLLLQCLPLILLASQHYDLIIIGGGASGMFASGAASHKRICILERDQYGGDCTNYACVPTNALKSNISNVQNVIQAVKARESVPSNLRFSQQIHFVNETALQVDDDVLTATHFLLATGADPLQPFNYTCNYRSIPYTSQQLLVIGGGPTTFQIVPSLKGVNVTVIAPSLLPKWDTSAQQAAEHILKYHNIQWIQARVQNVLRNDTILLTDGTMIQGNWDAIMSNVGRSPKASLDQLDLHKANVQYSENGVMVNPNTLRSTTNRRVFACGDCVQLATASHAAWTGFHAIRNIYVPWILRLFCRDSIHPVLPFVIYSDPEIGTVGLSEKECIEKYGSDGYVQMSVQEEGSDRADMDRFSRDVENSFIELRADKVTGRLLGCTAVGPAAAEIVNSMGMAIHNKLTVRDVARSIHSYPSHGYLLYRLSLSMALRDTAGFLACCGPISRIFARIVILVQQLSRIPRALFRLREGRRGKWL